MEGRQKNQIRCVCTRILETSEQGLIACTLKTIKKNFQRQMRLPTHTGRMNTPQKKK